MTDNLQKTGLKYGLFGSVLCVATFVVVWAFDTNPLLYNKLLDILYLPLFIFFGIKEFKNVKNNNELRFWQGMSIGMIIFTLMGVLCGLFLFSLAEFIRPDLLEGYIAQKSMDLIEQKEIIVEKMGEETFNKTLSSLKGTSSLQMGLDDYIKKTLIGMFFTVIFSIIFRTSNLNPK